MPQRPNILFLMTDQMMGRVLEPGHPCQMPNFRELLARGVRVSQAYCPNPVCSPSRASLMTGLLPHSHGVLTVTHCMDDDQSLLRTRHPHWAQRLEQAGYSTGYFGKWHIERTNRVEDFGWQVNGVSGEPRWKAHREKLIAGTPPTTYLSRGVIEGAEGYPTSTFWGVVDTPPERRGMGITADMALNFLQSQSREKPWCCFVSVVEPHDPYVCGQTAYAKYDVNSIELPPNARDLMKDKPGLYRKSARVFAGLTDKDKREIIACYWALITEIDEQFGRLLSHLESTGQLDNTIVVLTSDHGDFLGAHGIYQKNIGAFEECYDIPMLLAGPGIARGAVARARVGLHDLAPTLCELAGAEPLATGPSQSRSFASLLRDPAGRAGDFTTGYAEYFGVRYSIMQRVIWNGPWKLVWNGFDFDELYNHESDPGEMVNRIDDPACRPVISRLMAQAWQVVRDTNDHTLLDANYPALRVAPVGPGNL